MCVIIKIKKCVFYLHKKDGSNDHLFSIFQNEMNERW